MKKINNQEIYSKGKNRIHLIGLAVIAIVILLNFNYFLGDKAALYQKDFLFFGTAVNAQIITDDSKKAQIAFDSLAKLYTQIQKKWHAWQKGGLLSQINQAFANSQSILVPNEVAELITFSQKISLDSQGYFNPAIGKLIGLWGFLGDDWQKPNFKPPSEQKLKEFLALKVDMTAITTKPSDLLDQKVLSSKNPNVQLDMGAIAKGYALDLAINAFKNLGINSALVNAGGDIKYIGSNFAKGWKIGLENPKNKEQIFGVLDFIRSKTCQFGCAIATSGSTKRYFVYQGQIYSHLIDPKSAKPANHYLSVTVIDPSATKADAAASALFVAPKEKTEQIAQKMGIYAYLILDQNNHLSVSPSVKQDQLFHTQEVQSKE